VAPKETTVTHSAPIITAIIWDNLGCNDAEVQMTICLWVHKLAHWIL
jgi:hypothetical protein